MSSPLKLWCLFFKADHSFNPKQLIKIIVQLGSNVDDIKQEIFSQKPSLMGMRIDLWRPKDAFAPMNRQAIEAALKGIPDDDDIEQVANNALFLNPTVKYRIKLSRVWDPTICIC